MLINKLISLNLSGEKVGKKQDRVPSFLSNLPHRITKIKISGNLFELSELVKEAKENSASDKDVWNQLEKLIVSLQKTKTAELADIGKKGKNKKKKANKKANKSVTNINPKALPGIPGLKMGGLNGLSSLSPAEQILQSNQPIESPIVEQAKLPADLKTELIALKKMHTLCKNYCDVLSVSKDQFYSKFAGLDKEYSAEDVFVGGTAKTKAIKKKIAIQFRKSFPDLSKLMMLAEANAKDDMVVWNMIISHLVDVAEELSDSVLKKGKGSASKGNQLELLQKYIAQAQKNVANIADRYSKKSDIDARTKSFIAVSYFYHLNNLQTDVLENKRKILNDFNLMTDVKKEKAVTELLEQYVAIFKQYRKCMTYDSTNPVYAFDFFHTFVEVSDITNGFVLKVDDLAKAAVKGKFDDQYSRIVEALGFSLESMNKTDGSFVFESYYDDMLPKLLSQLISYIGIVNKQLEEEGVSMASADAVRDRFLQFTGMMLYSDLSVAYFDTVLSIEDEKLRENCCKWAVLSLSNFCVRNPEKLKDNPGLLLLNLGLVEELYKINPENANDFIVSSVENNIQILSNQGDEKEDYYNKLEELTSSYVEGASADPFNYQERYYYRQNSRIIAEHSFSIGQFDKALDYIDKQIDINQKLEKESGKATASYLSQLRSLTYSAVQKLRVNFVAGNLDESAVKEFVALAGADTNIIYSYKLFSENMKAWPESDQQEFRAVLKQIIFDNIFKSQQMIYLALTMFEDDVDLKRVISAQLENVSLNKPAELFPVVEFCALQYNNSKNELALQNLKLVHSLINNVINNKQKSLNKKALLKVKNQIEKRVSIKELQDSVVSAAVVDGLARGLSLSEIYQSNLDAFTSFKEKELIAEYPFIPAELVSIAIEKAEGLSVELRNLDEIKPALIDYYVDKLPDIQKLCDKSTVAGVVERLIADNVSADNIAIQAEQILLKEMPLAKQHPVTFAMLSKPSVFGYFLDFVEKADAASTPMVYVTDFLTKKLWEVLGEDKSAWVDLWNATYAARTSADKDSMYDQFITAVESRISERNLKARVMAYSDHTLYSTLFGEKTVSKLAEELLRAKPANGDISFELQLSLLKQSPLATDAPETMAFLEKNELVGAFFNYLAVLPENSLNADMLTDNVIVFLLDHTAQGLSFDSKEAEAVWGKESKKYSDGNIYDAQSYKDVSVIQNVVNQFLMLVNSSEVSTTTDFIRAISSRSDLLNANDAFFEETETAMEMIKEHLFVNSEMFNKLLSSDEVQAYVLFMLLENPVAFRDQEAKVYKDLVNSVPYKNFKKSPAFEKFKKSSAVNGKSSFKDVITESAQHVYKEMSNFVNSKELRKFMKPQRFKAFVASNEYKEFAKSNAFILLRTDFLNSDQFNNSDEMNNYNLVVESMTSLLNNMDDIADGNSLDISFDDFKADLAVVAEYITLPQFSSPADRLTNIISGMISINTPE